MDVAIGNAFILRKKCFPFAEGTRARSALSFRQALTKQLIGGYCRWKSDTRKLLNYRKMDPRVIRDDTKFGNLVSKINGRKKECVQCKRKGRKKPKGRSRESSWKCSHCDIPLCKNECFYEYHAYFLRPFAEAIIRTFMNLVCCYYRTVVQHKKSGNISHILKAFSVRHSSEYEASDSDQKVIQNLYSQMRKHMVR